MDTANRLTRVAPEDVGIASRGIEGFLDAMQEKGIELHSLMVLRNGRVAAEGWWKPYAPELPHMMFSLSKAFTSTAAGLAIQEGHFQLNDPVLKYFADSAPGRPSDNLKAMRVRDLLCMGTGHETEPRSKGKRNWEKDFLSHPVEHQPGTHFLYNSMATYMVASLVQRTTSTPLVDYLMPRLLEPIGIERPKWETNADGIACGGWGLNIKTEDILRFSKLMLQEGKWLGEQLVPVRWVRAATSFQIDNSSGWAKDWRSGYGFQFWVCADEMYRCDGAFCQFGIVIPRQNAVVAITAGSNEYQAVIDGVRDHIVPAMHPCLEPNPAASDALRERLEGLALPAMEPGGGEIAQQLLGRRLTFINDEGRPLRLKLERREDGLSVELRIDRTSKFRAGFTAPLRGVYNDNGEKRIAFAQARADGGGVELHIQMPETPFRIELQIAPDGADGVKARMRYAPTGKAIEEEKWVKGER